MEKASIRFFLLIVCSTIISSPVFSQQYHCELLQAGNGAVTAHAYNMGYWFGIMELPFLFIAVFFAFLTANNMKGGRFGKGMKFMAWGFLVMAVGHLHMQIDHYYGFNLFNSLLGQVSGGILWFAALILTWALSGMGFYFIYTAGKGA
jgi:hypothetical protein